MKAIRITLLIAMIFLNPITGFLYWRLDEEGIFTKWVSLGKPPEIPVKILAANERVTGVFIETASGRIYQYIKNNLFSGWVISESSENEFTGFNSIDCLSGKSDKGIHLRDEIANYPVYWCGEFDYGRAYYVINKGGSVWVWRHSNLFPFWAIHLCIYTSVGLVISIALFFLLRMTNTKRKTGEQIFDGV